MRISIAATGACLIAGLAIADPSEAAIKKSISIEAQDLSTALQEFAQETKLYVIYAEGDVVNHWTSGAAGEATQHEVLKQLLQGTGLTYKLLDSNTITIIPIAAASTTGASRAAFAETFLRVAQAGSDGTGGEARAGSANGRAEELNVLSEVVVTATKREARLQDVAASISAISRQDIERRGLTSMDDYLRATAGAYRMEVGAGRVNPIVIRGLTTQPETADPAAGVYFGETPLQSSVGGGEHFGVADVALIDMEQVEVLKGPQGTLYGSGALAGIVRNRPVAPNLHAVEGKVTAGFSSTAGSGGDNYLTNAVLNLPLVRDKLAARVVGYRYSDSGYVRNVAGSATTGVPPFLLQARSMGAILIDQDDVGQVERDGGRIAVLWQPVDAFKASYTFLRQQSQQLGSPEVMLTLGAYEQAYIFMGRTSPRGAGQETTVSINNLELNYELPWGQIMSSTSRVQTEGEFLRDVTIALLGPLSQLENGAFDEFAQEIRLTSSFDGPFQFLVGGFYEDTDVDRSSRAPDGNRNWWEGDLSFVATSFPDAVQPQTNDLLPAIIGGNDPRLEEVRQKAYFGELSFELVDGLEATLGARRFSYDKSSEGEAVPYVPVLGLVDRVSRSVLASSETGSVYKAGLSYKPTHDSLLYGQWSEGFRLGGPLAPPSALCDPDGDGRVTITTPDGRVVTQGESLESDRTDNLELGGKLSLLEGRARINASIYSIDWHEIPITAISADGICGATLNAGEARSRGVELETDFLLSPGLNVHLGVSYVDAELTSDAGTLGSKGDRLPGSPRFSANAAVSYDFSVLTREAYVRADLMYAGEFYNNLQQLGTPAGGYHQLNVRSGITIGPTSIDLYANNLTNSDDLTWVYASLSTDSRAFRLRPRTVGVQFAWSFE